ncbi:MAG: hypothetical protein PHU21_00920 [Elusimicrobia bacterium]|nr:hypothetical protein [Elusimicrobiota bacterium]
MSNENRDYIAAVRLHKENRFTENDIKSFVSFRARQIWTLDNGKKGQWPRILSYIVEPS